MDSQLTYYVLEYGYLAIFILIFLQEIGVPNPIPNELVLAYSGYLCSIGVLQISLVILTAFSADFIGTNILYFAFYYFGEFILKHKPKWLPISAKGIEKASKRVSEGGIWAIYIGRITPFLRGYTSIIAALLHIKPRTFLPIVVISALTWSITGIMIGRTMGQYWGNLSMYMAKFKYVIPVIVLLILIFLIIRYFKNRSNDKISSEV